MPKKYRKTIALALLAFSLLATLPARAQEGVFDPGNIISDEEILNSGSMTQAEIQAFLENKRSFLATYQATDPNGVMMPASQAIYERAISNGMNPKFILVLLQKEQGLVENAAPSQSRLDWATGYGCPDGGGCNERFRGFWKQINSATLQFRYYMEHLNEYRYQVGQTYTFTNPYSTTVQGDTVVTIANRATAALYIYTPHVYNGNFNFWKLWQRYFSRSYLNGSLLQASGDSGVWLIQNGFKRPFLSRSALTSRYDPSRIQIVSKSDLDKYPKGEPIRFSQYSIIRIPDGKMYLIVNDAKLRFANMDAFRKLGYNPEEVISASAAEVAGMPDGPVITTALAYPTGALLQDKKTGGIYWVENNTKSPLWDGVLLRTTFKGRRITSATTAQLATYATGAPVKLSDGDLVRTPTDPAVYVIENGLKRPFLSASAFEGLGYKWTNVVTVSPKLLGLHAEGQPVSSTPSL